MTRRGIDFRHDGESYKSHPRVAEAAYFEVDPHTGRISVPSSNCNETKAASTFEIAAKRAEKDRSSRPSGPSDDL